MVSENPGVKSSSCKVLFSYSTIHLLKKDKIRFYYALKGRDGKSGVVARTNTLHLGKTVLLTPIKHDDELKEFLLYWKCDFTRRKIMVQSETTYNPKKENE